MIQHAFSMPSLVNFISKDTNLVFYLSAYQTSETMSNGLYLCLFSVIGDVIQKVQRHRDLIKAHDNVYQATCNAKVI